MIEVRTVRNNTRTDTKTYCFSVAAEGVADRDEIIKQMVQYNSTLTEADAAAALTVMEQVVNNMLMEGYKVKLPWATLCLAARGTAESESTAFINGKNDNHFELRASANRKTEEKLSSQALYKSKAEGTVMTPQINLITHITKDAKESVELKAKAGEVIRIHGDYLAFDADDEKQGVFLTQNGGKKEGTIRAKQYIRRTRRTIDIAVPQGIASGEYTVIVATKQKTSGYMTEYSLKTVLIE